MALKSAGSSPAFPNIKYNTYSYIVNHFNISNSKRLKSTTVLKTRKSLRIVTALKKYGLISIFVLNSPLNSRKTITFTTPYYSTSTYYSSIRLVSTPSKAHYISLSSLKLAAKSIGSSVIFLETSKGIISHSDALRLGVAGKLLCVIL